MLANKLCYNRGMERTDEELAALTQGGDKAAMEVLLARYERKLATTCKGWHARDMDLEDWLIIAKLTFARAARRYDPACGVRFSTFMYSCVKNKLRNTVRNIQTQKDSVNRSAVSLEEALSDPIHPVHARMSVQDTTLDDLVAREDIDSYLQVVRTIYERLTPRHRRVLELRTSGAAFVDIAEDIGASRQVVNYIWRTIVLKCRAEYRHRQVLSRIDEAD